MVQVQVQFDCPVGTRLYHTDRGCKNVLCSAAQRRAVQCSALMREVREFLVGWIGGIAGWLVLLYS